MTLMKNILSILSLFLALILHSQELPPIETFTTSDYAGENQNWMISQDSNNYIYVANNLGLLEFNGSEWTPYRSPNNTILRAVKVIGDRVYSGCYEEFGYWERNKFGQLDYTSLIPELGNKILNDDQIWNIISYDDWVLFQAGHALYFYHKTSKKFKTIISKNIIYKVFNVNNRIYYHVANEGIYVLEEGKPKLMVNDSIVLEDRVIGVFQNEDKLIMLSRNSGFFELHDDKLEEWNVSSNERLKALNVFSSIQLKDGSFVLGTISNGLVKINRNGEIEYEINQKKGLANNTVLSLFEDYKSNVWTGLDNGLNCINVNSAINTFIDYNGDIGTVYTTLIFNNFLYVGTNQGLFYRSIDSKNQDFKFVKGTAGQVWSLFNDNDGNLFCGHHLGTFLIEEDRSKSISSILGAWNFKTVPNHANLLLQGNYDGLYVLQKNNNSWRVRNKIEGFKNSSRFFEINDINQILVNHEYKGVFRIQLDSTLHKVIDIKPQSELALGKNSGLITYKDQIIYTSEDGVFNYIKSEEKFEKNITLSEKVSPYKSVKMVVDQTGKLWLFSEHNISFIDNDNLTNQPEITTVSIPSSLRKGVLGFENIQHIEKEKYVIGTSNGYLTMDLSQIHNTSEYVIYLNSAKIIDLNDGITDLPIQDEGDFKHKQGTLVFDYSVPEYNKFLDVNYQYKLNGKMDRWSAWSKQSSIQFENLPFGDYTLEVRAKVGNKVTENNVNYHFNINRPWYFSNMAILFYVLLLVVVGLLIHRAYKFYYERILKHEHIKSERAFIQIKNEKLNQDIEGKNRELAISTMSIIKKNELLRKIKKELKTTKNKEDIASAIDLIDTNLNNNKDWKFFKEAFNNADKDFMDKIKAAHPELTPNDLKFCAYLRLNLSSKEMAPLLNISIKSVETKRYRLRKRLQLHHDDSLVNYILKF
ncbi:helix-turn-helix and ligand-binding sensor domain-containing protein [Winogradskyella eximia]|uniref:helix-turn-helix and ligand-binding sensor domain-containing protein n=1 Tax=Winogradskyella eximia TaxID=262006 RepID=UPI00248FE6E8|nr:triple tyrosine motif-containing protein [Winogradskyella eximia]